MTTSQETIKQEKQIILNSLKKIDLQEFQNIFRTLFDSALLKIYLEKYIFRENFLK